MSKQKTNLLREYITEAIRVTIQQVDPSGEIVGGYSKQLEIGDDDADEVEWFLDKYGRAPINYRKDRSEKSTSSTSSGRKKKEPSPDPSELSAREVISRLTDFDPSGTLSADELFAVIKPWGQDGFDALRRILITSERTNKSFPFFSYRNPSVGDKIDLPDDPSRAVVDYLLKVRPRVGINATGTGEFLLALLTGGIAGGPVGDLAISGQNWEVKDTGTGGPIRLGDTASGVFRKYIQANFKPSMTSMKYDVDVLLADLQSKDYYESLPEGKIKELIDAATSEAVNAEGLAGFALLAGRQFEFYPSTSARFSYCAKNGRLHIVFEPNPVKESQNSQAV